MQQAANITVVVHEGLGAAPDGASNKAHHVRDSNGKTVSFRNPHASFVDGVDPTGGLAALKMFRVIGRFIRYRWNGKLTMPNTPSPPVAVRRASFLPTRWPAAADAAAHPLRATWLGHACYYVEFPSGLRVLFDPVFEDRCAPLSWIGPRRVTPPPCTLADLPAVDAVVISHSHYDHLSGPSVQAIRQHHPHAHFFVGLGLAAWFHRAGIPNVTELDWWQDADATITLGGASKMPADAGTSSPSLEARFACLPSQHVSARSPFDHDRTLWCSWAVSSGGRSVYFAGDTGYRSVHKDDEELEAEARAAVASSDGNGSNGATYAAALTAADDATRAALAPCPEFAHIGRLRGPFDLGLLPIGAYKPRSLFSGMHADPLDAVDILRDARCARALAMHWGTWALTVEPMREPPQKLRAALHRRGLPETGVFDVCDIGESRTF